MRCAIYARFSSDLQRPTSIEDQVRRCTEFAAKQGWTVVEELIRCDEARSAATVAGRDALNALMVAAKTKPKPFDCLLVDDTSRLARYLPDVLSMNDILLYHGVFIYAVAQRLDCREKTSRPLLTLHGMMDEQFLVSLGEKVHRGQEGRALKGMHPGGKVFGYRNTPIEDPTRTGKYGRAAVSGVKLELDEVEAPIVERVFSMYANGSSLAAIAKILNAEGVQAPQPPRNRQIRAWCPSSIREMLRNGRYRGVFVWNRTKKERNPETGRKTSRPRPESDWMRVDVPEWRIISEELWARVEAQIQRAGKRWSATSIGGQGRRGRGPKHLFSGFLICGVCGSRMTIVSGNGRRGYVKYGCPSHRNRGVCANSVMIRKDRLEDQLLAELSDRLLQPAMVDYALQSFHEQLQRRLQEIRDQADSVANGVLALQGKRQELKAKATNVTEAIAAIGHSPSLLAQLAAIETEIAKLDDRLTEMNQPRDIAVSLEDLREVLHERAAEIGALLRGDVEVARQALAKYVDRLVLTPKSTPDGPVLDVSGSVEIFSGNETGDGVCISSGGQRRDRTADAGLFRAALYH
jgi:site-specific DNA recombinase